MVRPGLDDKGQKGWYGLAWMTRGRRGGTGWPGRLGVEGVVRTGLEDKGRRGGTAWPGRQEAEGGGTDWPGRLGVEGGGTDWPGRQGAEGVVRAGLED